MCKFLLIRLKCGNFFGNCASAGSMSLSQCPKFRLWKLLFCIFEYHAIKRHDINNNNSNRKKNEEYISHLDVEFYFDWKLHWYDESHDRAANDVQWGKCLKALDTLHVTFVWSIIVQLFGMKCLFHNVCNSHMQPTFQCSQSIHILGSFCRQMLCSSSSLFSLH